MKKLFVLAFSLGVVSTSFAQYGGRNESRDVILGRSDDRGYDNNDRRYGNSYGLSARDRDLMIQRINRDIDARINAVQRDRYLRRGEQQREIRELERERRRRVDEINDRYRTSQYGRNNNNRGNRW